MGFPFFVSFSLLFLLFFRIVFRIVAVGFVGLLFRFKLGDPGRNQQIVPCNDLFMSETWTRSRSYSGRTSAKNVSALQESISD